ncbi:hypothetical protein F1737_07115 [Methanoplanus sp. FWC-SCC4]|uniref:Uncharacterized protein n=1 Tax=Methanochimaera problematica TaxID=2609417 RepID=A0AA97FDE4_9EURY|nr:hypothetical protein [Methanoplanus sp. FWC-SCC4]WOF16487.1 hypothetical protein F1737_07115 [Methanoplanus sp. FWC-SCC4]
MEKNEIIVIILGIALIFTGGYIIMMKYSGNDSGSGAGADTATPTVQPVSQYVPTELQNGAGTPGVSYVHAGEVLASPSVIKSMDLYAEPVDWDSEIGNDGIVIHFNFYDEQGRKVIFSGTSMNTEVNVYTPDIDKLNRKVSPRKVIYKGYTTITSSDEGEGGSLSGLRVAYDELNLAEYDKGVGQVKVTVGIPTGGSVSAEETFLYTRK